MVFDFVGGGYLLHLPQSCLRYNKRYRALSRTLSLMFVLVFSCFFLSRSSSSLTPLFIFFRLPPAPSGTLACSTSLCPGAISLVLPDGLWMAPVLFLPPPLSPKVKSKLSAGFHSRRFYSAAIAAKAFRALGVYPKKSLRRRSNQGRWPCS